MQREAVFSPVLIIHPWHVLSESSHILSCTTWERGFKTYDKTTHPTDRPPSLSLGRRGLCFPIQSTPQCHLHWSLISPGLLSPATEVPPNHHSSTCAVSQRLLKETNVGPTLAAQMWIVFLFVFFYQQSQCAGVSCCYRVPAPCLLVCPTDILKPDPIWRPRSCSSPQTSIFFAKLPLWIFKSHKRNAPHS